MNWVFRRELNVDVYRLVWSRYMAKSLLLVTWGLTADLSIQGRFTGNSYTLSSIISEAGSVMFILDLRLKDVSEFGDIIYGSTCSYASRGSRPCPKRRTKSIL